MKRENAAPFLTGKAFKEADPPSMGFGPDWQRAVEETLAEAAEKALTQAQDKLPGEDWSKWKPSVVVEAGAWFNEDHGRVVPLGQYTNRSMLGLAMLTVDEWSRVKGKKGPWDDADGPLAKRVLADDESEMADLLDAALATRQRPALAQDEETAPNWPQPLLDHLGVDAAQLNAILFKVNATDWLLAKPEAMPAVAKLAGGLWKLVAGEIAKAADVQLESVEKLAKLMSDARRPAETWRMKVYFLGARWRAENGVKPPNELWLETQHVRGNRPTTAVLLDVEAVNAHSATTRKQATRALEHVNQAAMSFAPTDAQAIELAARTLAKAKGIARAIGVSEAAASAVARAWGIAATAIDDGKALPTGEELASSARKIALAEEMEHRAAESPRRGERLGTFMELLLEPLAKKTGFADAGAMARAIDELSLARLREALGDASEAWAAEATVNGRPGLIFGHDEVALALGEDNRLAALTTPQAKWSAELGRWKGQAVSAGLRRGYERQPLEEAPSSIDEALLAHGERVIAGFALANAKAQDEEDEPLFEAADAEDDEGAEGPEEKKARRSEQSELLESAGAIWARAALAAPSSIAPLAWLNVARAMAFGHLSDRHLSPESAKAWIKEAEKAAEKTTGKAKASAEDLTEARHARSVRAAAPLLEGIEWTEELAKRWADGGIRQAQLAGAIHRPGRGDEGARNWPSLGLATRAEGLSALREAREQALGRVDAFFKAAGLGNPMQEAARAQASGEKGPSWRALAEMANEGEAIGQLLGERPAFHRFCLRLGHELDIGAGLRLPGQLKQRLEERYGLEPATWKAMGRLSEKALGALTQACVGENGFASAHRRGHAEKESEGLGRLCETLNAAVEANADLDGLISGLAGVAEGQQEERSPGKTLVSAIARTMALWPENIPERKVRGEREAEQYLAECRARRERLPEMWRAIAQWVPAQPSAAHASGGLQDLADFLQKSEAGVWQTLPERFGAPALFRRVNAWHEMLTRQREQQNAEKMLSRLSAGWSAAKRQGDWHDESRLRVLAREGRWPVAMQSFEKTGADGAKWEAVALDSAQALFAEGQAMHHCVSSYADQCASGESRIYSILRNGKRLSTLQVTAEFSLAEGAHAQVKSGKSKSAETDADSASEFKGWKIAQNRGLCNEVVGGQTTAFCKLVAKELAERSRQNIELAKAANATRAAQPAKTTDAEEAVAPTELEGPGRLRGELDRARRQRGQAPQGQEERDAPARTMAEEAEALFQALGGDNTPRRRAPQA
jgi:hypothetical protein